MKRLYLKKWLERMLIGIVALIGIISIIQVIIYATTARINGLFMMISLIFAYLTSCVLEKYGKGN